MDISLTPELEALIRARVDSGHYASSSEVVREALRLLDDGDELLRCLRRAEVRANVAEGLHDLDTGDTVDGEAFFRDLLMTTTPPGETMADGHAAVDPRAHS